MGLAATLVADVPSLTCIIDVQEISQEYFATTRLPILLDWVEVAAMQDLQHLQPKNRTTVLKEK